MWLLSAIIVTSMICSYIVMIRPPREPAPPTAPALLTPIPRATDTPSVQIPTPTPSVTPTPAP